MRSSLLISLLTLSVAVCGLAQTNASSAYIPAVGVPVSTTPSGNGNSGAGYSYASSSQNVGISLGSQTGISLQSPVAGLPISAAMANVNVPASYGAYAAYSVSAEGTSYASEGAAAANSDLGPSYYENAMLMAAMSGMSVAEVADQYKSRHPQNVRVYTNEDAERIMATVKTGKPPVQQTYQPQYLAQNTPPPAITSASESAPNAGSSASDQDDLASAPQSSQQAQTQEQGEERLPATSTFLPMLGLLGLLSGGAGVWLLKLRR